MSNWGAAELAESQLHGGRRTACAKRVFLCRVCDSSAGAAPGG